MGCDSSLRGMQSQLLKIDYLVELLFIVLGHQTFRIPKHFKERFVCLESPY